MTFPQATGKPKEAMNRAEASPSLDPTRPGEEKLSPSPRTAGSLQRAVNELLLHELCPKTTKPGEQIRFLRN